MQLTCSTKIRVIGDPDRVEELMDAVKGRVDGSESAFVLERIVPLPTIDDAEEREEEMIWLWGCGGEPHPVRTPVLTREHENAIAVYKLYTSGQPPIEAIGVLGRRFPDLELEVAYSEPRLLGRGSYRIRNGIMERW